MFGALLVNAQTHSCITSYEKFYEKKSYLPSVCRNMTGVGVGVAVGTINAGAVCAPKTLLVVVYANCFDHIVKANKTIENTNPVVYKLMRKIETVCVDLFTDCFFALCATFFFIALFI